ncbi:MAG: hypothetical protein K0R29_810 [Pseudobdellovibrio sp.]|jgi:hypothetical protein|nr:hypothetical protein [Pseudobdellovibrio sp.]
MRFCRLLLLFVLAFPAYASASAVMCKWLFHTDDRVSQAVRLFQGDVQDTTALRQEVKFVVKSTQLESYLPVLEKYFGERFKNRDKAPEGYANITSTNYMTVGKYIQNGKRLSAKVRFRKYFTRALADVQWRNLIVQPELADRSWLELKIQHPEFDNVVFKPRLIIYDKDIPKLITEKYFDYKEGIVKRLLELNPKKAEDVRKFIAYFDALYTTPAMRVENMFAQTQYERTSYSIKLKNGDTTIDVQITLDQNVRLTRLKDGSQFNAYGADETVVEVKIPVQYAKLTDADLAQIPELAEVKKLIEMLTQNHVDKYPINRGKMSKIDKKNDMQDDPDTGDYD